LYCFEFSFVLETILSSPGAVHIVVARHVVVPHISGKTSSDTLPGSLGSTVTVHEEPDPVTLPPRTRPPTTPKSCSVTSKSEASVTENVMGSADVDAPSSHVMEETAGTAREEHIRYR
jgi:hypothetical protein